MFYIERHYLIKREGGRQRNREWVSERETDKEEKKEKIKQSKEIKEDYCTDHPSSKFYQDIKYISPITISLILL